MASNQVNEDSVFDPALLIRAKDVVAHLLEDAPNSEECHQSVLALAELLGRHEVLSTLSKRRSNQVFAACQPSLKAIKEAGSLKDVDLDALNCQFGMEITLGNELDHTITGVSTVLEAYRSNARWKEAMSRSQKLELVKAVNLFEAISGFPICSHFCVDLCREILGHRPLNAYELLTLSDCLKDPNKNPAFIDPELIRLLEECLNSVTEQAGLTEPLRRTVLNIATTRIARFRTFLDDSDIDATVDLLHQALENPADGLLRPVFTAQLGMALGIRFRHRENQEDLTKAIELSFMR